MKLFDTHVHSSFSFDSSEDIENYVKKAHLDGEDYFITTEHMDLESNFDNGKDIVPDFENQKIKIKELSQKYDIKVLYGVEMGWRNDIHERNKKIVSSEPFDMVILSVHESEECDVSFPEFRQNRTADECYNEYLNLIYEAVMTFDDFDTLAHIDYVLRYVGDTDLSKHEEMLKKIFDVLIHKDKALEINTKIFPDEQSVERAEYLIKLYTSVGGYKFTIGSDAHKLNRHKNCFDRVIKLLKKYGINSTYVFVDRKSIKVSI